ncbi:MAG: Uma2 family endonuclease [Saprospiraceae bacterium]|nr:Uma2 family endonuclease [Saprospiraceae bacterium]
MRAAAQPFITDLSQLDPNGSYTYSDYLLWQFQERVELIRGKLFRMSPAPNVAHQRLATFFTAKLFNFFEKKTCQVFAAPFDVRLPVSRKKGQDTTVVQPDLCVICDPAKLDEHGCAGAPDLVVEILSPGNSTKEMREKYRVYEEAGVREYWIVNPAEKVVFVYILDEKGNYIGLAPVTGEDALRAAIFTELVIDLKEIFS